MTLFIVLQPREKSFRGKLPRPQTMKKTIKRAGERLFVHGTGIFMIRTCIIWMASLGSASQHSYGFISYLECGLWGGSFEKKIFFQYQEHFVHRIPINIIGIIGTCMCLLCIMILLFSIHFTSSTNTWGTKFRKAVSVTK